MMTDAEPELTILAMNSGSSSLKFGLYRIGSARTDVLLSGAAESVGGKNGKFFARDASKNELPSEAISIPSQRDAIIRIERLLADAKMTAPVAVGHRIVHGGPRLRRHCLIDDEVLRRLEAARAFAPLHIPSFGHPLRARAFSSGKAGSVFRHRVSRRFGGGCAGPSDPQGTAIGGDPTFHGLSCESIVRQLAGDLPDRLIIAHLGNGASVTAVKAGKSIDTSMGLTPTGGVIMSTRSGDLDPGVLVYLMREKKFDAGMLEEFVDGRSGLLGISGIGGDMRRLHESAPTNARARLAIEMFCYSVRKQVAAMIAALDGVDLVVFTGGIGENDEEVRATICRGLSWIGVSLDEARNASANNPVSGSASRCAVRVLASQEDEQIARHTSALLRKNLS
jgi:acetate kinase